MKTILLLMLVSLLSLLVVGVKVDQATVNLQKMHRTEVFKPMHNKIVMMQPVAYNPETEKEAQAAWDEFNKFAKEHNLKGGYLHPTEDSWSLALFVGDDADVPKWAVYDLPTLTEAVKQIESDYKTYPNGHNVE
jgi:hypothetical protein